MICQSKLLVQWQPLSPPQHPPLPYSNGYRAEEVVGVEVVVGVAKAQEAAEEVAEEVKEEAVHLVDNLLLHPGLQHWLHLQTTGRGD